MPYWEPAKWVAKVRAMRTNDARIVLVTNMRTGHFDVPGRFASLEEVALIQAFALDVTGLHRPVASSAADAPSPADAIAPDADGARSSGGGVTTGLARSNRAGTSTDHDAVINEENKTIDRKVKSICRGC